MMNERGDSNAVTLVRADERDEEETVKRGGKTSCDRLLFCSLHVMGSSNLVEEVTGCCEGHLAFRAAVEFDLKYVRRSSDRLLSPLTSSRAVVMLSQCACGVATFLGACLVSLLLTPPCDGGKVLVFPVDGSHWINMKILIEELHARGHSVTVIRASTSWYIKEESPLYTSITISQVPDFENFFGAFIQKYIQAQREQSAFTAAKLNYEFLSMIFNAHSLACEMGIKILDDENVVKTLVDAKYDMVLADPAVALGVILAKYLKLPMVLNVRWLPSGEGHFAIAPSPLSYVPVLGSGLSDRMSFIQRIKNVFFYGIIGFQQTFLVGPSYNPICNKYFEGRCDIISFLQEADIWLFRSDFVFDFPRPTMPNVVYIGGFQCKPAQSLPADLEEFVQSAGEHGVIIMTLGTLVGALPGPIAEEIASVFAKMPQKVIWRHVGERPATLGNNTLLMNWIPQKDLLGHPQIKVFVAHGGTNGIQEAIYHGVPVLGLPLFFDQFDNLIRLQERGAAKIIELADLNTHTFEQGLKEVLHQDHYRQNMQRLSSLHKDQPIKPMDHAIFWLEYVMRHKGAPHLRTEAYKMPWYSYYCLDVLVVLLTAVIVLVFLTVKGFVFLCCRGRTKTKAKQH
ncbi:UDP glucuronosyltransferase 5 family, polypeptide D1 [Lampris incognitus]|uniref:UDP glucuronosyltransferase 5 family, polypeptide D1 n=1 Tax=Lampris incognitus TaxID=2546036 RepID=UPI0024B612BF|nr:UDP glucuronosyltransferase 5 family, polypeptide D1 [Lampris incognitus]